MKRIRPRPISESSVHGIIVSGEASESEEEFDEVTFTEEGFTNIDSTCSKEAVRTQFTPSKKRPHLHKSLLHQKLFEANIFLQKSITSQIQDPLYHNASQVSRLRARLGPVYTKTTASHHASKNARENVAALLDQLSKLDHSQLPSTTPISKQ